MTAMFIEENKAPANLRCTHDGCPFYAAVTYQGRKLCGHHAPAMPHLCPACEGSGEVLTPGGIIANPHDPPLMRCPACDGNGTMTTDHYRTYLSEL